jgi:hypothetical protein
MVLASLDFRLAKLNRGAISAGTSIPSESVNPTARLSGSSTVYIELMSTAWKSAALRTRERVDPAFEVVSLAGEDGGVAEGVREERGTLDAGEEGHGEVACVASAQLPELVFGPVDDDCHHGGCVTIAAAFVLIELGAECPHRAAVARDGLAHV